MNRLWRRLPWLLLALPLIWGFSRLQFDAQVLDLLPPDQPAVQGLKAYQEHFANARELILMLEGTDSGVTETLAGELGRNLRLATNLVATVSWTPPWQEDPALAAEFAAYLWFNQPPRTFSSLTNRLAADHRAATLAESREVLAMSLSPLDIAQRAVDPYNLLSIPALQQFQGFSPEQGEAAFAAAEGRVRMLYVQARPPLTDYRECISWLAAIRTLVEQVQAATPQAASVAIHYTGRPVFVTEMAGSMRHDLSGSLLGTAGIIALLFWLMHRRWLPMLWLLALLALVLALTIALGSLLLGPINVISLGFAAVLLGLAVDYAVLHYQEALFNAELSVPQIRRVIAPSILWAAITTISAFLVLNLGGLPGLAQLGTLVAIGVALAALVMVLIYLPPLFPHRRPPSPSLPRQPWWQYLIAVQAQPGPASGPSCRSSIRRAAALTLLTAVVAGVCLILHRPALDPTADALKPKHSEAEVTLEAMTAAIGLPKDPLWLMIAGPDETAVGAQLDRAEQRLQSAISNQVITGYALPTALWPRPEQQAANRPAARALGQIGPALGSAAVAAGFQTNALFLTEGILRTWSQAGLGAGVYWPTNALSQWLLKQFVARSPDGCYVMGLVYPPSHPTPSQEQALSALSGNLAREQLWLCSWKLLAGATLERVESRFWWMVLPMLLLVLGSLWLAFRRWTELFLGLAVLLLSALCLLAVMGAIGWSWNLLNLMAVPLILGTGVDYTIFTQMALRRHGGDLQKVWQSTGRALLLCGGTAITGFGALGLSSQAGMASLGRICAAGIAANMMISIWLLPAWWNYFHPPANPPRPDQPQAPSRFYSAGLWRLGLKVVRLLPASLLGALCHLLAEVYYRLHPQRRATVIQNLLPVLRGDRAAAARAAHRMFHQFANKLKDLWRYEAGLASESWHLRPEDWDGFQRLYQRGRGVLLVTPHLGNWELGGPELVKQGVKLVAITQAEPGAGLTELRQQSRSHWGIETIVIGQDGFAFVDIIKRLQEGATIALLIDRPPREKAVTVNLFERPFLASMAAAELARASGCALLGVTIVWTGAHYEAHLLPEFVYDRQALGQRQARAELTQQILRAFEPEIQHYPDQWFHFIPIWPAGAPAAPPEVTGSPGSA